MQSRALAIRTGAPPKFAAERERAAVKKALGLGIAFAESA